MELPSLWTEDVSKGAWQYPKTSDSEFGGSSRIQLLHLPLRKDDGVGPGRLSQVEGNRSERMMRQRKTASPNEITGGANVQNIALSEPLKEGRIIERCWSYKTERLRCWQWRWRSRVFKYLNTTQESTRSDRLWKHRKLTTFHWIGPKFRSYEENFIYLTICVPNKAWTSPSFLHKDQTVICNSTAQLQVR